MLHRELVEFAAGLEGFQIGNSALVGSQEDVAIAVNQEANCLMLLGQHRDMMVAEVIPAGQIVAVELIKAVRTTTTSAGGVITAGDFSGLVIGSSTSTRLESVRLKILVRDVQHPWIVFTMPDYGTAENWRGVITLLINQAPHAPAFQSETVQTISLETSHGFVADTSTWAYIKNDFAAIGRRFKSEWLYIKDFTARKTPDQSSADLGALSSSALTEEVMSSLSQPLQPFSSDVKDIELLPLNPEPQS